MNRSLLRFEEAIKSEATRKLYERHLESFLEFTKIKSPDGLLQLKDSFLQELLEDYLFHLKKRISPNSIPQRFAALELFFAMNDKNPNFKRIRKMYPSTIRPTGRDYWATSDIKKMLANAKTSRMRAIIHLVASTGCRIGVIEKLRLKHVSEIENLKAVKFYDGTNEEYYGFLTPEASKELDDYLNKRRNDGEILTGESPLFRKTYAIGSAKAIPISISSLKHLVIDLVKNSTLSRAKDGKRHNIQLFHGFRKRFNNILKDNKEGNIALKEKLMGHKGVFSLDGTYHNPDLRTLFEEFKNHIVNLTVDDSERNKIRIRKLESEKSELEKGRLEIDQMKKRIEELEFGVEAREGDYTKNMLKFLKEKNRSGEVISMLWHFLFERMGTEEEKRRFLKRAKKATENGEKFGMSWFEEFAGLNLENSKRLNNTA